LLHEPSRRGALRVPHQAIVEFVAAVTRPRKERRQLLTDHEAWTEAEHLMASYPVLYPNEAVLHAAFRGAAVYQLPWFDAHLWAYAECFGLTEIYSEDFQHGRLYGRVRATNPFL
jgi:predicted nucleic acid-binding protein